MTKQRLFLAIAILSSYAIPYKFRYLDRNIFYSWDAIFKYADANLVFLFFLAGLVLAYIISESKIKVENGLNPLIPLISVIFLSALFWNTPDINPDTARYFNEAKLVKEYGAGYFIEYWGKSTIFWTDLPVVPFIFGFILKLLGESRIFVQIFNTFLFYLTIVLTYFIGKRFWGGRVGVYAALLLVSFPYLLSKSSLFLVDIPVTFFLTAAVYATIRAFDSGVDISMWIVPSSIFISLVFLSKISAWPFLAVVPVIPLLGINSRRKKALYLSGLISLPTVVFIGAFILFKHQVLLKQWTLVEVSRAGILQYPESTLSLFLFQTNALIALLAIYSMLIIYRKRDINYTLLFVWISVPLLFLHDSRIRYMVPALPALALMAAITINSIKMDRVKKFLVSGLVLCSLTLAIFGYLPYVQTYNTVNLKNVAEYTNSLNIDNVEVYTFFPEGYYRNLKVLTGLFDLYSDKKIIVPQEMLNEVDSREYSLEAPYPGWTWSYEYPPYYSSKTESKGAIMVITPAIDYNIPAFLGEKLEREYRLIKVYSPAGESSMGPYAVRLYVPKMTIIIITPKGGELWKGKQTITWDSTSATPKPPVFNIIIHSVSTSTYKLIGETTQHSYTFNIDELALPPASDYKIKIYAFDYNWREWIWGESDTFSIVK